MNEYIFIYRGGERPTSQEEGQKVMQAWYDWIGKLMQDGTMKNPGAPLEPGGKMVTGKNKTVTDGPYPEKDLVGGFSIVNAKSIEDAVEISKGCPVFLNNGAVEVRPVMQINM